LTRCAGFQVVGGRGPATVEGTVVDDDPLHPVALRVRRGQRGSSLIPIELVEGVSPTQRILYVRRPPSRTSRAAARVSALGPHGRRAARSTALSLAAAWKFGAPRASASARASVHAGRRQWPWIRRLIVGLGQGVIVFSLVTGTLVVAGSIMAGRFVRLCFRGARRLAPHVVRGAGEVVVAVRRTLRPAANGVWSLGRRYQRPDLYRQSARQLGNTNAATSAHVAMLPPQLRDGVDEAVGDGAVIAEAAPPKRAAS
jgi:hypothetical protein